MMKMDTGDGPPSGRVSEQGPDWVLVATEACGRGPPDLGPVLEVLGYIGRYGREKPAGGCSRGPRDRGARPTGERALVSCGCLEDLLT